MRESPAWAVLLHAAGGAGPREDGSGIDTAVVSLYGCLGNMGE